MTLSTFMRFWFRWLQPDTLSGILNNSLFILLSGADVDDFTALPLVPVVPPPQQVEELVANIKTIVVKIEAASGRRFVPMLILEASMHAIVKDWSSRVSKGSFRGEALNLHCIFKHVKINSNYTQQRSYAYSLSSVLSDSEMWFFFLFIFF